MFNQQYIKPSIRTFHIEIRPDIKISDEIFLPIESNNSKRSSIKTQQIMHIINHEQAYNHKEYQSTFIPINSLKENSKNLVTSSSSVIQLEQSLTQPIPDSIINDKQTTNRIFNEKNSTHFLHRSNFIKITPINSSSSNHIQYYQIGSILTSTSTLIMHQNKVIAHATTSNPFLSDTIFIILIATLTVIILLFCLGLFCLCRRSTKRNISPSFDGSSYVGLNSHSFTIPIDDHYYPHQQQQQQQTSKPYITDIPLRSSINQATMTNDPNLSIQPAVLHQTLKQKFPMNNKKLKKKRVGFCCCCRQNSKQTQLKTINARTR